MVTTVIAIILILAGLVGIIFPVLPGLPLIYGGVLLYALIEDPAELSTIVLIVFGGLTLISLLIDWFGRIIGARYGQASRAGEIGGLVGLILGILFAPLGGWSIILLPPLGVIVGELTNRRKHDAALKAGFWTLVGTLVPMLINLILAGIMIGWFIAALV